MIKNTLNKVNRLLNSFNNSSILFWQHQRYNYQFSKNVLILSNRILRQLNTYQLFRWQWMIGVVGMGCGWVVSEIQEFLYGVICQKELFTNGVNQYVLKNKGLANKIGTTLDQNIFRNPDIQYYFHQVLLNQVLDPNKQNITKLILTMIKSQQNTQYFPIIVSNNIKIIQEPIKRNTLQFLNSEIMKKIVCNGLISVLNSLDFKQFISNYLIKQVVRQLSNNKQQIYKMIKSMIKLSAD